MNLKKKLIFGGALFLGALGFWTAQETNDSTLDLGNSRAALHEKVLSSTSTQEPDPAEAPGPAVPAPAHITTSSKKDNLKDMAQTLSQYTRPETRLRDLVEYLQRTHQEPIVVTQSNPATGEMAIVRTKSPLPGTRYFHAQYMTNENQQSFVQHMSFEYEPGATSMEDARTAIQNAFPSLGSPKEQKDGYYRWDLNETYIVWIKKMGPEDLQDDPFNAYTPEDVGTVRVAIEVEIHGDDDEHSH